jgi:hypothetical protein
MVVTYYLQPLRQSEISLRERETRRGMVTVQEKLGRIDT